MTRFTNFVKSSTCDVALARFALSLMSIFEIIIGLVLKLIIYHDLDYDDDDDDNDLETCYHLRCTRIGRMAGTSACTQTCIPWKYLYSYSYLYLLEFYSDSYSFEIFSCWCDHQKGDILICFSETFIIYPQRCSRLYPL